MLYYLIYIIFMGIGFVFGFISSYYTYKKLEEIYKMLKKINKRINYTNMETFHYECTSSEYDSEV